MDALEDEPKLFFNTVLVYAKLPSRRVIERGV